MPSVQSPNPTLHSRTDRYLVVLYIIFASIAALQSIAAHLAHPLLIATGFGVALAIIACVLLVLPLPPPVVRALSKLWPWLLILGFMAAADIHRYAITIHSPDPLTTGLALSEPAHALLHGQDPYSVRLPGNAPISPGPGWILLLLPFAFGSSLGLLNAIVLAAVALLVWQWNRFGAVALVILSLAVPMFIAEASHGQDLFAISFALAGLCIALHRVQPSRRNMLLLGVLGGLIATARVPIILFVLVIAVSLWKQHRAPAVLFAAIASITCLILHLGFALWVWHDGQPYPPLHIAGRAAGHGGAPFMVIAVLLFAGAAVWTLRWLDGTPTRSMVASWLLMTLLFAPAGIKELVNSGFNWAWEGDNYISFPLPLLIAAIALRARKEYPAVADNSPAFDHQLRIESASHS